MAKIKTAKKADDPKKPIYTGSALETGIIFAKLVGNVMYHSVAVRAKDGEISMTSKVVRKPESTESKIALVRSIQKMFPVTAGASFKLATMKALKAGNGKFVGEIALPDNKGSRNVLGRIVSQGFNLAIFGLLPVPILHFMPIQNPHTLGVIESFVSPVLILTFLLGTFKLLNIGNHLSQYHGAEHKVIKCFNAGEPLTIANVKKFRRDDVQCGTNFMSTMLIATAVVGSIFFSFVGIESTWLRTLIRVATLPVTYMLIMGLFRWAVKSESKAAMALLNAVSVPGLWLQRAFSTKEPDDEQLEVAIAGFNALLAMDEEK